MTDSTTDFRALVERVRLGDDDALAELMQRYEAEVRLTARLLLGRALRPHLDSVDLLQSLYHSLLVGLRDKKIELGTPQQFLGLAVTIVRRKVARHWRHIQRQQRIEPQTGETEAVADLITNVPSPEVDPAETAQFNDSIAHLCSKLDDKERQLVELRLQGYSTAEVARQLGLDPDVLRVRLSRLRRRLREHNILPEWI
jgi:RNA polymerase sigma-70 factor (ECF subfamily)